MNTAILILLQQTWLEQHALTIIAIALTGLTTVLIPAFISLIRLGARVEKVEEIQLKMEEGVNKMSEHLSHHTGDAEMHVNHLHMKAIDDKLKDGRAQMDKLENSVVSGFRDTLSRIDRLTDRLLDRKD